VSLLTCTPYLGDLKKLAPLYFCFLECHLTLLDESQTSSVASSVDHRRLRSDPAADEALSTGLSNRELDVLILLQERLTNKEIAQRLFVSAETVKTHTANICRKLDLHQRRQGVVIGKKRGLLSGGT
jgi:ATP/maltotriose-dependent transcriptional regulator MalT